MTYNSKMTINDLVKQVYAEKFERFHAKWDKYGNATPYIDDCPELKAELDALDEETRNYIVGNNN